MNSVKREEFILDLLEKKLMGLRVKSRGYCWDVRGTIKHVSFHNNELSVIFKVSGTAMMRRSISGFQQDIHSHFPHEFSDTSFIKEFTKEVVKVSKYFNLYNPSVFFKTWDSR